MRGRHTAAAAAASGVVTALALGAVAGTRGTETLKCPTGYAVAELHAVGQRLETGFAPRGDTAQVVTPHNLTVADGVEAEVNGNYIPFLVCARPWNDYEREQANRGLGTDPVNFPFIVTR